MGLLGAENFGLAHLVAVDGSCMSAVSDGCLGRWMAGRYSTVLRMYDGNLGGILRAWSGSGRGYFVLLLVPIIRMYHVLMGMGMCVWMGVCMTMMLYRESLCIMSH